MESLKIGSIEQTTALSFFDQRRDSRLNWLDRSCAIERRTVNNLGERTSIDFLDLNNKNNVQIRPR